MATVYLHDKEKQEPFLDKQSIIDNPEGSNKERGLASDQHNINIMDLEPHPPQETCWIHRVPEKLRNINKEAYTPQQVSIGPLHHGNPKLIMQSQKIKYEQEFWNRDFCKHIPKGERMKFMETEDWLEDFQSKYAVTFESVDTSALKRVILQDACFISELFLRNYEIQLHNKRHEPQPHDKNKQSVAPVELPKEIEKHTEDYILRRPWVTAAIRQDLILLENQLPYPVLIDLFDFIFKQTPVNVPTYLPKLNEKCVRDDFILKIAAEFFLEYYKFGKPPASGAAATTAKAAAAAAELTFLDMIQSKKKINCDIEFKNIPIKHFTDLVRYFMLPFDWKKDKPFRDSRVHCLYSATQLDRAGVKFQRGDKEARLADIKKKGGLCWLNGCCLNLQVPELSVKDDTECIMRNVMALEQFVYPREPFICNYVFLLNQLISTEEDVQFLIDKKIVSNGLGSNKAVVDLVNKLCYQIAVSNFFYDELCEELNKHHDNAFNVSRATLERVLPPLLPCFRCILHLL